MIVYKATSKTTGKSYIGATSNTLEKRKSKHKYASIKQKRKRPFYTAILELGWDDFEWSILYTGECSEDELSRKEEYYINLYDTLSTGYNTNKISFSNNYNYDGTYCLTHKQTGHELTGSVFELSKILSTHVYQVISGLRKSVKGYELKQT